MAFRENLLQEVIHIRVGISFAILQCVIDQRLNQVAGAINRYQPWLQGTGFYDCECVSKDLKARYQRTYQQQPGKHSRELVVFHISVSLISL